VTPWQWWWGHDEFEYSADFATRDEAIAAALRETSPGEDFHIIEARSSESAEYEGADIVPFLRTRNHEILTNGPRS